MESPPPPTPSRQGRGNLSARVPGTEAGTPQTTLPCFSRSQLGVILLLGAALLLLWAWRANFGFAPSPPPARTMTLAFVEVAGAVAHPGLYSFPQPPSLAEVWRQAGGPATPPSREAPVPTGTRVEIDNLGHYQLTRLSGAQLVTLGLALDLNQAEAADLDGLPGIGPALAQRIIEYREKNGPFKKIEDLQQVSGIGPAKLEKIKPYLLIEEKVEPE